jgi:hypothetical protein
MRLLLMVSLLAGMAVCVTGCSSSSSSAGNNPKLVNPPDPKLQPVQPSSGGAGKANSTNQ